MKLLPLPATSFLFLLLFLSGCGDKPEPPEQIDPDFRKYISAYTSGEISRASPIRIRLIEPVESEEKREAILEKKLFTFDPSIEGKLKWDDRRTIAYEPNAPLPSGQRFKASFQLGKLIDSLPQKLNTLEFGFSTIQQDLKVHLEGTELYRMDLLRKQMVKGILKTADVAEKEEVEECMTAIQSGKELEVNWDHDVDGTTHHFTVDSVRRKEKADSVVIRWNGAPLGLEEKGRKVQGIPAIGDFKVMEVDVKKNPEQHVLFRFSDPLDPDQDMNGLVRIEDQRGLRTSISGTELKVYPQRTLSGEGKVRLSASVENVLGHSMEEAFERHILFEAIKPQVKLLGSGTILPDSKGLHLPFKAVNLSAVDLRLIKIYEGNIPQFFQVNELDEDDELRRVGKVVHTQKVDLSEVDSKDEGRWTSYHLDLEKILQEKGKGAIYRVELGFPKRYSEYPCSGSEEEDQENGSSFEEEEKGLLSQDMGYRSGGYYHLNSSWRNRKDPCAESYYYGRRNVVARNVFASNIGLLAKKGSNNTLFCAANDIRSSEPISGARIKVLDYQQRSIGVGKTDGQGKASINIDGDPYLLVAEKKGERAYLRVDGSSSLSTSKFNVNGQSLQEGLKGFPYTERGVYRPGDSIHLSFILDDREMKLPQDHPVKLKVSNPRNNTVHQAVKTQGNNGFYYFPFKTSKDAPTGNYYARIKVGGASFSERIRVETIKPNRLRIETDWEREVLQKGTNEGILKASWLHGAKASGLRAVSKVRLNDKRGHFEHPDYIFRDPTRSFHTKEETIFEGHLDENGVAEIQSDLELGKAAPGILQAHFTTRVYERSGNASVNRQTKTYSPYNTYLGLKMPETRSRWGYLKSDEPHRFAFLSVDENGSPLGAVPMNVKVYRIEHEWWYDHSRGRDLGQYIQRSHREAFHSEKITTDQDGRAELELNFEDVRWGHYLIRACSENGDHCTGKTFSVSRYGRPPENAQEDATLLSVKMDEEKYEVGEKATVTVPTGGVGKVLLSLEDGSSILNTKWLEAKKDSTRYSFEVTEEMTPNIYAHATLIQPHAKKENELPNRLFGIAPVEVYDPKTELNPEIEMPGELAPEESFKLSVSESNGKEMSYTVAIVDEGLLDLTNFQTPDPWEHFYAKEAHGINTWDLYDRIMGAESGQLRNILAVGGGDGQQEMEEKDNVDRFDPMVKYLGPFTLNSGATNEHEIEVPNYIGSVRTMVVAGKNGAYGHADTVTPVKEPLMVLSTLPRVLGPKETVKVPVSVFAMEEKVRDVELELRSNELLSPTGPKSKTVHFEEPGEKLVSFEAQVAEGIGKGEVEIIARSGNEKASHRTEIEVRNPNPTVTRSEGTVLQAGKSWESRIELPGMAGTNSGVLEFSSIPAIDSERRIEQLIQYPHGCVEQIVSAAFPQLYLDRLSKLTAKEKSRIDEHVRRSLRKLRNFQTSHGAFSYWPGRRIHDDWGTSYAGHFMLEAEEKGYKLPSGLKQDWLEAQSEAAREWSPRDPNEPGYYRKRDLQQAYRLYTLALADEPVLSAMNRLRRTPKLSDQALWRLGASYYLAGQRDVASSLIEKASKDLEDHRELAHTYGSGDRDRAMILETLTLMGQEQEGMELVKELAKSLRSDRWMSTQTTAYSLMAIAKYVGEKGSSDHMSFSYSFQSGRSGNKSTELPISRLKLSRKELKEGNSIQVDNEGEGKLFVRKILRGKPAQGQEEARENGLRMEVSFGDAEGNPIDVTRLEQGTDFVAEVKVKNPGLSGDYEEMALTRIFPSGWEIRNARLADGGENRSSSKNYEDVRDDRVLTYFDLDGHEQKSFYVQLHASYLGRFYFPGTYCEAMYDGTIHARTSGKWVEVVKPGAVASASNNP